MSVTRYNKWLTSWILLFFLSNACAQSLSYKQFTEEDGLPSLTTYEIVQDSSGILWIGTSNGLVSYDGEKFEKYLFEEFQDNDILQVFIHETGDVGFVNLANEVGLLKNIEVLKYNFNHNYNISLLVELFDYQEKNYFLLDYKHGDSVTHIQGFLKLENGIAYNDESLVSQTNLIGHSKDLFLYVTENNQHFAIDRNSIKHETKFFYYTISRNSTAYLRHRRNLIYPVSQAFIESTDNDNISFFIKDKERYLYLRNNIIYSFDTLKNTEALISNEFTYQYLFIDRENILWASTQNNGLIRFDNFKSKLKIIDTYQKEITSLDKTEESFLATNYEKAVLYDDKLNKKEELFFRKKRKSRTKAIGREFIIFNGTDLYTTNKLSFTKPLVFKSTPGVKDFIEVDNMLILGTLYGLLPFHDTLEYQNKNLLKRYYIPPFKRISKLILNKSNRNLYVGTTDGFFIKRNLGKPEMFCNELQNKIVTSILNISDSTLLVGTENHGLFKLIGEKITDSINIEKGLLSNSINDFTLKDDNLIIATNKGISLYKMNSDTILNLTTIHGLPSNKVSSVIFDENTILAGVGKSLIRIDLDDFNTTKSSSKLTISRFLNNNEEIDLIKNRQFKYNENKIEIYFNHVSLRSSSSEKSFKYRIKEIENKWFESKDPMIRLPALQPGNYSIEAFGLNEIGDPSNKVELEFKIKPPWWQTTVARILGVLAVLLIIYLVSKYRIGQFKKKEAVKRDYLTQINQIKDQALQLQMNPHFIFNSLNAIQNFIGSNDEEKAMNYLARFARLIRLIFEYSKGNKISVEQEIEFIKLYLNLEKLRFKDKVEIEFIVDDELDDNKDVIEIPPLLIQPIVENSFKHGLFHKIGKGKLKIHYGLEGSTLKITVEDDGIGRDASKKGKSDDLAEKTSSGLSTTNERLNILNFDKEDSSNSILVEDLKDANNNALGTRTTIILSID